MAVNGWQPRHLGPRPGQTQGWQPALALHVAAPAWQAQQMAGLPPAALVTHTPGSSTEPL